MSFLFPRLLVAAAAAGALLTSCESSPRAAGEAPGGGAATATGTAGARTPDKLVKRYNDLATDILDTRKREVDVVREIVKATHDQAAGAVVRAKKAIGASDAGAAKTAIEEAAVLVGQLGTEGDLAVAGVRKRLVEGGHHFNPLLSGAPAAPGGAHTGNAEGHHAPGDKAAHAAPGDAAPAPGAQPPAGHADGKAAGHHAEGQAPAHHADGKAPAHHAEGQPPGHAGEGAHHKDGHHHAPGAGGGYDPGYVVVTRAAKKSFIDSSRALAAISTAPSIEALDREWAKVEATWNSINR
jgi:hypothetical protein